MRRAWGRVTALAAACALVAAAPASAATDASPPGSNVPCTPTAAKPRPLVLVHGLGANQSNNFAYLAPQLKAAGWCVFSLTYGQDARAATWPYSPGGVVAMEESAKQLEAFVDSVLRRTGATEVDLVGHSEGTVMPRVYLEERGGAAKVRNFVALTPLWRGTELGGAALLRDAGAPYGLSQPAIAAFAGFCGSCPEFLRGSDFLNRLNADGEAIPGVTHTNIVTRYDELVVPYTSGLMRDGGTNIVLQDVCPLDPAEHLGVAFDPNVLRLVENALDPATARRPAC